MTTKLAHARLYGIVDLGYVAPESLCEATRALCIGGVDLLQLRAKKQSPEEICAMAREIRPICSEWGIPFIINDFPEIARDVGADGVHIGQDDGTLAAVREVVGKEMIVGRSTHSLGQARAALAEGFDYLGFGPLFPTPTKLGRPGIGLDQITTMEREIGSQLPVFCIGGITFETIDQVLQAGAQRMVMVSALLRDQDIGTATARVKARLWERDRA